MLWVIMMTIIVLNGSTLVSILWIVNTVSDIFWIWDVFISIWFTIYWKYIFINKYVFIVKYNFIIKLSNETFTFWKLSVTTLNLFSKLEADKRLCQKGMNLYFQKLYCFVIEDYVDETLCTSNLCISNLCISIHVLLSFYCFVQIQSPFFSNLNYIFVCNKLGNQYYK